MSTKTLLAIALLLAPLPARAGAIEKALAQLAPEERSHQVCALKGLETVRRDARLRGADRLKSSIFTPAVLDAAAVLTAKGGAVRSGNRWYALSFTCKLTADLMKATSFTFAVGEEVPMKAWDKYGLWR
jgi:hypothetical protein